MDAHLPRLARTEPPNDHRLRPVAPLIWATRDEPLGGPANTCGFLIEQPGRNAFIYSCAAIEDYYEHIDELGGVSIVLLNHRDEATPHVTSLATHYDATVHTHAAEVVACTERGVCDIEPLSDDSDLGSDLSAIHAPGHTPGTTAYLFANPTDQRHYLFTGDTFTNFTIDNFARVTEFHPYANNVSDMRNTLALLDNTKSDILMPGLANGTINAYRWDALQRHTLMEHAAAQLQ
jgi:glyoxylase-like metal-dependent hydrolase (beta-lactamase superfamily II)